MRSDHGGLSSMTLSYFVLNNGQFYDIQIEADQPIELFCLFFAPEVVDDVRHSISSRTDRLLT